MSTPLALRDAQLPFPAIADKRYKAMNVMSSSRGAETPAGIRYIVDGVPTDAQPSDKYALNVEPVASAWYLSSVFEDLSVGA